MRRAPLMARPRQTESESVPIWLKLSEADAEQMDQVLARPEFAGWTKAEWCLEIIQTALRYYSKRPVAEPGRARASTRPAATEPEPSRRAPKPGSPVPEPKRPAPEPKRAAPEPKRAAPEPESAVPEPKRAAPRRKAAASRPRPAAPKPRPVAPGPVRAAPAPEAVAPEPEQAGPEPQPAAPESPSEAECLHPADARDYQTGTCAACGAILWD